MTTEEKAKAYDEALEKARKRVAVEPQDHTDAILKDIFPELRESEDERMIRKIESFLSAYDAYYFKNDEWREIEVWLEKQKEQKPVEWSEEDEKNWRLVLNEIKDCELRCWFYSVWERLTYHKPQWKPSEEQMDRLFSIVAALRKDYCDDMADFLANLHADLKKLGVKEKPEYYQHFNPDC